MTVALESVPCALCGGAEFRPIARLRDRLGLADTVFDLVECSGCAHAQVNPRPALADLGRFYPPAYWAVDARPAGLGGLIKRLENAYRRHLLGEEVRRVRRVCPPGGRLLDVGCGSGEFMALARAAGMTVQGVEFAPEAAAYASNARGLDVRGGTLEEAAFPDGQFDAVTLWHVLEHVPDPVGTLREVRRVLRPGAVAILQVPNWGSLQARTFRKHWYAVDVPRHLHHFTPAALRQAVARAGLAWAGLDHRSARCNAVILASTLVPALEPHAFAQRERAGHVQALGKACYLALTWFLAPWAELESLLGRGAVVTATVRREDK